MRRVRKHSGWREFLWFIFLTLTAVGLALPLALWQHQLSIWDILGRPASRIYEIDFDPGQPPPGPASRSRLIINADAFTHPLPVLNPEPDLLNKIMKTFNGPLLSALTGEFEAIIEDEAQRHQVSAALIKAVIQVESNFNPAAVSKSGAVGLMQILPSTARAMGISDPMDPRKNISAGAKYLKILLDMYEDNEKLALAAYNCGPEAMKRFGNQLPPFKETKAFVDKVLRYYTLHLTG